MAKQDHRQAVGRHGEDLAVQHLVALGHDLVERNWRCEAGELDLITQDGECLTFVEVRTRRGRSMGSPEESITAAKQTRLATLGEAYVQAHDWRGEWRIDVVAIELDRGGRLLRLDHYENAISG